MKIFKKTISFIVIIMLVASLFSFNVCAASAQITGAGEYEVGKSFSVTVKFNADATLYAVEADVSYNSSVLQLLSVSGADYNANGGTIKIVDDGFSAAKPSKTSSYTLNFKAIAAGNSNIAVSLLGGGEAESKASATAAVKVVTPKPSANANLSSIKLNKGSLSPAFNAATTNYSATVKYDVDEITITASVADGKARCTGAGTFALEVGNNEKILTVTAENGTRKTYTVNIKRMTEQETLDAEQAERDANPLLVVIDGNDYKIVNDLTNVKIPTGFVKATEVRKESEITVLNDAAGEYQLVYLVDANGENGAFYKHDANDNFTKLVYVNIGEKMYIIEAFDTPDELPDDYKYSNCVISGVEVKSIGYADEKLKDFNILNCYVDGAVSYYRLDSIDGTMQRAVDFDIALENKDTEEITSNEIENQSQNNSKITKKGLLVIGLVALVAVILVVLAIVLIIKIASSGKKDDQDQEQEEEI